MVDIRGLEAILDDARQIHVVARTSISFVDRANLEVAYAILQSSKKMSLLAGSMLVVSVVMMVLVGLQLYALWPN